MVKFGKYLREQMHPPWAREDAYIDYTTLKQLVYAAESVQSADPAVVNSAARHSAIDQKTAAFMQRLDTEIERVTAFYTRTAAELRAQLSQLQAEQQSAGASEAMVEELRAIGRTAVLLVQFLELNLTGLRKILKKHEKRIRGHPVAARYLASRRDKESALQCLHNHAELDEIYDAVREAINVARADMQVHELASPAPNGDSRASTAAAGAQSPGARVQARAPGALNRQSTIYAHEPILREMALRLRELDNASRFVNTLLVSLAETSGITMEEGQGMSKSDSKLALGLNLLSTFIFMVNYYVVVPSSSQYCSALGAPPSFSGVVVGILPAAACLSAVVYSYATQFSYRVPLMVSAVLCCAGNLVYALALPSSSLHMLLAGRVLIGMGGARVVNRRYIADHVDLEYRTEASAAFVAFTALGMAVGPGVAAAITALPESEVWGVPLNDLTIPGYAMLLLWLPYLLVVAFAFVEPPLCVAHTQPAAQHGVPPALLRAPSEGRSACGRQASAAASINLLSSPLLEQLGAADGRAADGSPGGLRARLAGLSAASKFGDSSSSPLLTIEPTAAPGRASRAQLRSVGVLLWLYLMDKLFAEAWLTSVPIVAFELFGWAEQQVGVFLCVICALVLPASQVCTLAFAAVSAHKRERTIISVMMCLLLAGGGMLLSCQPALTDAPAFVSVYVLGAAVFFLANNLLEAATMSLLSRKMPKAWAAGILNSGFLTTLTGLGGRVLGNLLVSLLGSLVGLSDMNNALLIPLCALWGCTMALYLSFYASFLSDT